MKITDVNRDELTNGMRQYYDIKIEHLDKVVLFQLGDFYELFFEDAIEVANLLELTLTKKSAGLKEKIPMAGVPLSTLDVTVKRLMDFNKTVAIVKQDDLNSVGKKLVERKLEKIVTPGTYFDVNSNENNFTVAISQGENLSVAYGDLATGEMFACDFVNRDEAFNYILTLGIKEIIDPEKIFESYHEVTQSMVITVNTSHEFSEIKSDSQEQAVSYLTEYLKFVTRDKIEHLQPVQIIDMNNYMQMSLQTQKQLELLTTLKDNESSGTLYWFLNRTSTAMGRRALKRMVIQPLLNQQEINRRHNIVDLMLRQSYITEMTREILKQIYDFERLIGRLSDEQINPKELNQLKLSIAKIPDLKSQLSQFAHPILDEFADEIDDLSDIHKLINKQLMEEAPMQIKDGNIIKNKFNDEVDRLRDIKQNSNQWLANFEIEEREKTGIKTLKVKYNKIFGYFIEVTNSFLNLVPDDYVRKQTMANCERYITEELKVAENDILNAAERLNTLEMQLYTELRQNLKVYITRLQNVAHKIAYIDVMCSFATVSNENNLVRPEFNEDNKVELIESWHPIVKKITKNFIHNDVTFKHNEDIILITGPNMSGKSTYMRQFVLTVIMAQIGCFVPAKKANLKQFDRIFTRIGASDDLASGKSTFMVEMAETAEALNRATANSILIFDELGRGTSTYDGVALASAILEYIHENLNVKTMFSTHYHELVDLQQQFSKIKNVHVKAKKENGQLKFYHKVLPGGVEKSYGIEVAKLANLPEVVTNRAQILIEELEASHKKIEPEETQKKLNSKAQQIKNNDIDKEQSVEKPVNDNEKITKYPEGTKRQVPLFDLEQKPVNKVSKEDAKLAKRIKELDLLKLSPLDALILLNDLQNDLK